MDKKRFMVFKLNKEIKNLCNLLETKQNHQNKRIKWLLRMKEMSNHKLFNSNKNSFNKKRIKNNLFGINNNIIKISIIIIKANSLLIYKNSLLI